VRMFGVLAAVLFALTVGAAGAENLRVYREHLRPDPCSPDTLTFTVTVEKAGSYAVRLLVQGEEGKDHTIQLTLQPEGSDAALSLRFSFTGQGCG
jgi:hypothetical protein